MRLNNLLTSHARELTFQGVGGWEAFIRMQLMGTLGETYMNINMEQLISYPNST